MTVKELRNTLEFRCFIDRWVQNTRPDLEFADYLREWGLDAAADCVVWATTVTGESLNRDPNEVVGPYPYQIQWNREYMSKWRWYQAGWLSRGTHCVSLQLSPEDQDTFYDTAADALIGLLELWGRYERVPTGV